MAASHCAVCSGAMVLRAVEADRSDDEMELRTYECDACGHSQTYSVTGGDS
jgi:DNA-directed RNA polymerase subunit M/transcription elongation factor TFIIS